MTPSEEKSPDISEITFTQCILKAMVWNSCLMSANVTDLDDAAFSKFLGMLSNGVNLLDRHAVNTAGLWSSKPNKQKLRRLTSFRL